MQSPAKAHWQRAMAANNQPAEDQAIPAGAANQYELMLLKLAEDKRRLKDIQSIERKIEVKATLLPDYLPWIEGVLAAGAGRQDDVLMTVFVWAIDIADFALAIKIGAYAIEHGLTMPDQYKRDVPCVLAEEVADVALKESDDMRAGILPVLLAVAGLVEGKDMPDEVRAKLHKAIGYAQRAAGDLVKARESLALAIKLHDKVGVKKDIERLDVAIKNSAPPAPAGDA
ncbi:phage terminase small subunit [Azonexus sp. R2A61]|uniref:phage terminase small subunit n=1 Tax=Azonexus sp. R2A61 TaxID=2744443 RepID=UPI001F24CD6B|nr:phage terminase small subunit [Azonexus sp. R2A61]